MYKTEEEKAIREENEQESIMESTENVEDISTEYDVLWGAVSDPSINASMTKYILDELNISKEDMIGLIKRAHKSCQPSKEIEPYERYKIALNNSLDAMKISKRFMKGMTFDNLSREEIRSIVSQYYSIQSSRVAITNQVKAAQRAGKECAMLSHFSEQLRVCENNIKTYIDVFTNSHPVCVWMKSITGIGPIIAAGLISYFDITKTQTAGGFWKYVGWTGESNKPTKGEKLNYNPKARVLCWKAASSFKMRYTDESCYYGSLYYAKKEFYKECNDNGMYKDRTKKILDSANYKDGTSTKEKYEQGMLSDGHIDAMAMRFSAKIFLSHLFDVWYMYEYGQYPPVPFAVAHLGHVHIESVPNFDVIKPVLEKKWPDVIWDDKHIYSRTTA